MNRRVKREVETGTEYSFPDYMGDIKKILSSRARCRDIGKLCADGVLEVNGVVEYDILYADSENKLTSITTSSDYTVSVPVGEDTYRDSLTSGRVNSFSLRVTGPRKLSMKSSVENDICITHDSELAPRGGALDGESACERSTRVIKTENLLYGEVLEREYAEEAERLPELSGEELEIIGAGGNVRILEANAADGGVEIKGELILSAIVKAPGEPPFRVSKTIPILQTLEINGAERNMPVIPRATVTSVSFGQNDEGDDKVIVANGIVEFSACAVKNEEIEVILDAYLLDKETKGEYSKFTYDSISSVDSECIEVSSSIPRDGLAAQNIRGILSADGEICDSVARLSSKGAEIEGKIALTLVACEINDDGSANYFPIKHTFDFSENVNISGQIKDNTLLVCTASVLDVTPLIDGDEISVKCSLGLLLSTYDRGEITKLDSLSVIGELPSGSTSTVTVYYPTPGDTLFSVAKKYHKSLSDIAKANSLTEGVSAGDGETSFSGVKKLFVF